MSLKGLRIPDDDSKTKGVVLSWGGSTDLTITPATGGISTLKKSESVQIMKSDKKNDLITDGYTIASVWNHSDGDHVEVFGGTNAATGPITIKIQMVDK